MTTLLDRQLANVVQAQPYPLLFVTVSGAHLYGFPSPDSDYDLRGVHILPLNEVVGLKLGQETIEVSADKQGLEIDLVTHDAKKFFLLLLKKNGYVLEQLYSPLVLHTSAAHDELKSIAKGCVTRHHVYHYSHFAAGQWDLLEKQTPPTVKALLYLYRVLLTGIHLMQTGEVEANLLHLNERFRLPYVPELVDRKVSRAEKTHLDPTELAWHQAEYTRLQATLESAAQSTTLPADASAKPALNDLLVRLRLKSVDPLGAASGFSTPSSNISLDN